MVYNDTSTAQGVLQEIDFLLGTNVTTYTVNDKTRNVNRGMDRVAYLIQSADGKWNFEDANNTDQPIAFTNIVASQQDYGINTTFLKIKSVYYKNSSGNYEELTPVDDKSAFLEMNSTTDIGIPSRFCLIGNSIFLDSFPQTAVADGLKVLFVRNIAYFTPADTTKIAGFNPQFHRILSLYGAYDYAIAKGKDIANSLRNEILVMERSLQDFYSGRDQTQSRRIKVAGISNQDYQ